MAALTPSSVVEAEMGPFRVLIASFTTVSVNDTWTSGIQGVVGFFGNVNTSTTQASAGLNVDLTTASTGVFTFKPGEDGHAVKLFVVGSK